MLNIIGGLDIYTDGDLIINGKSTKTFTDENWDTYRNHSIGFVFQNYNLIPHQTILANVELALTLSGVSKKERRERAVSALMKRDDVDKLVIATDAGREGELVARWIMMKAHCKKPAYRLWISSQTDKAIKEGFQNLRPAKEYDNLYHSAQARAEADWLVGLNTTRALTCKYNAQLSAGRVQTPTLALIVKREEEILAFQPKDYYSLQAVFKGFNATFRDKKNNTRFSDKAFIEKIAEATKNKKGNVVKVEKTSKKKDKLVIFHIIIITTFNIFEEFKD